MAKSRTQAARRDAEHQNVAQFDAGDILDISASAIGQTEITSAHEEVWPGPSDAADATGNPIAASDSPLAVAPTSPNLVQSPSTASPSTLSTHRPPTPSSPAIATVAADTTFNAVNIPPSSSTTVFSPFSTLATNTTPPATTPASFNTSHTHTESEHEPAPTSNTPTSPSKVDSLHIPPMPTSPPPPPPTISSIYPFSPAPTSAGSIVPLNGGPLHHPLAMHTRVNSSAEDWTPEGEMSSRSMHVTDMHNDVNRTMELDGEGEQTLVEDELRVGQRKVSARAANAGHSKSESISSLGRGGGRASASAKGHTPKAVSQSSAAGERWDPLQHQDDEANHERDRTLLGEDMTTSRKPSENAGYDSDTFLGHGDGDIEEQDVGVSLDKHLHTNSTGRRGAHANEYRKAEVSPMQTTRRTSHLKLDIHPPSPPPWEVIDPPLENNTTAVGTGGDYYSPTASKFRTLQSSGPRTLIPKSSYYFGPPPPDSAYGTPPTGHIGVHHPREILRIERDYTCGEIIQFAPIYPLELEGRITPTHFLESINSINELLISAHSTKRAMFDNMLAIFSLQLSKLVVKSHFDREMLRLRKLIDGLNASLYNPVGLNILYPRDVAFLYVRRLHFLALIEEGLV